MKTVFSRALYMKDGQISGHGGESPMASIGVYSVYNRTNRLGQFCNFLAFKPCKNLSSSIQKV